MQYFLHKLLRHPGQLGPMLFLRLAHLGTQQRFGVRAISGRELASAVLLVIEVVLLEQLVATLLESALAPVLSPELGSWSNLFCHMSCPLYLFQTLPATGGQRGGEIAEAQLLSLESCLGQSQRKALLTAQSPFGLVLQPANACTPPFVVIVTVYPFQSQTPGMALTLVLADLVFLARPDIGIEIEDGGTHAISHQPLHNS